MLSTSHNARVPLNVSWVPVRVSDTNAVLRARVERRTGALPALTISVTAPPDVRVVRGASPAALSESSQQAVVEREFEFAYARTPDGDILLSVDGDGEAMGVHGRAWYRFGRPEPVGPRPEPSGVPLVIGGRNFGSPIRADSPTTPTVPTQKMTSPAALTLSAATE